MIRYTAIDVYVQKWKRKCSWTRTKNAPSAIHERKNWRRKKNKPSDDWHRHTDNDVCKSAVCMCPRLIIKYSQPVPDLGRCKWCKWCICTRRWRCSWLLVMKCNKYEKVDLKKMYKKFIRLDHILKKNIIFTLEVFLLGHTSRIFAIFRPLFSILPASLKNWKKNFFDFRSGSNFNDIQISISLIFCAFRNWIYAHTFEENFWSDI